MGRVDVKLDYEAGWPKLMGKVRLFSTHTKISDKSEFTGFLRVQFAHFVL